MADRLSWIISFVEASADRKFNATQSRLLPLIFLEGS